jgi:hypothetical protein
MENLRDCVVEKGVHSLGVVQAWVEESFCTLDCCECSNACDSLSVERPVSYEIDGSSDRTINNSESLEFRVGIYPDQ